MENLSHAGRIFYGIAIAAMGLQIIYYKDFPYMLLPPNYTLIPGITILAFATAILFILAGECIVSGKKARVASLLLAVVLLLIFCFYYIPYQLMSKSSYLHFGEWENAAKELTLAGGAFVVAGCFAGKNESPLERLLARLIPFGSLLFPVAIFSFGIDHFVYAKEAADYVPSWVPGHLFWMYFCGVALLGSALAIVLKIRTGLFAALLGIMIFIWFVSLHVPRIITASSADMQGELTSALLALAYSGIAFAVAGGASRRDNGGAGSKQDRAHRS